MFLRFEGNSKIDRDFESLQEAIKKFESLSSPQLSPTHVVGELDCETTIRSQFDGSNRLYKTCLMNATTLIDSNKARIKFAKSTAAISFKNNKNISYLPIEISKALPSLQILEASYCNVTQIGPENFQGLIFLKLLWLSSNKIESIPSNTFKGLTYMENIDLSEFISFHLLILLNLLYACFDDHHIQLGTISKPST